VEETRLVSQSVRSVSILEKTIVVVPLLQNRWGGGLVKEK